MKQSKRQTPVYLVNTKVPTNTLCATVRKVVELQSTYKWLLVDLLLEIKRRDKKLPSTLTSLDEPQRNSLIRLGEAFPKKRRKKALSFEHHVVCQYLEPDEQEKWLTVAQENKWNHLQLRKAIRAASSKLPKQPRLNTHQWPKLTLLLERELKILAQDKELPPNVKSAVQSRLASLNRIAESTA